MIKFLLIITHKSSDHHKRSNRHLMKHLPYSHTGEDEGPVKGIRSNLEGEDRHGFYVGGVVEHLLAALIGPGNDIDLQGKSHVIGHGVKELQQAFILQVMSVLDRTDMEAE